MVEMLRSTAHDVYWGLVGGLAAVLYFIQSKFEEVSSEEGDSTSP